MMNLPRVLSCITIEHVIDDPDTIEQYLVIDHETTEKCLPIALRNVINQYAALFDMPDMKLPDAETLRSYLQQLWQFGDRDISTQLDYAIAEHMPYLAPYFLMKGADPNIYDAVPLREAMFNGYTNLVHAMLSAKKDKDGNPLWKTVNLDVHLIVEAILTNNIDVVNIVLSEKPACYMVSTAWYSNSVQEGVRIGTISSEIGRRIAEYCTIST